MDFFNTINGYSENLFGFQGVITNGSSSSSSLILDKERGELVRAMTKSGQKEVNEEKALIALRNHSETERRRRERINVHLATLRSLIPGTNKGPAQAQNLRDSVSEVKSDIVVKVICCLFLLADQIGDPKYKWFSRRNDGICKQIIVGTIHTTELLKSYTPSYTVLPTEAQLDERARKFFSCTSIRCTGCLWEE